MTLLLVALTLFPCQSLAGTGHISISVPLHFADAYGHAHTIVLGIDSRATYGFDAELEEMPVPPVPVSTVFDVRFLDPDGRKQYPYETSYRDFRPYVYPSQRDTFHVRFQPAASYYPMIITWTRDATRDFEQATMVVDEGGTERKIDMISEHRAKLMSGSRLMIITRGPRQKTE